MTSIPELRTALKAAKYQLSRTRLYSKQRYGLILCINYYTQQINLLTRKGAA